MNDEIDYAKDLKNSLLEVIRNTEEILIKLKKSMESSVIDEKVRNSTNEILESLTEEFKKLNLIQNNSNLTKFNNFEISEEE